MYSTAFVIIAAVCGILRVGCPAIAGPDEACAWLAQARLDGRSGWLCCQNRTLSVQDGVIVGRRRGVTDECAAALATSAEPKTAVQVGGTRSMSLAEAVIVTIGLVIFSFVVCTAPCGGLYFLLRARLQTPPKVEASDSESSHEYEEMAPAETLHL